MKKVNLKYPIKIYKKNKDGMILVKDDVPILEKTIEYIFVPERLKLKHIKAFPESIMGKINDGVTDEEVENLTKSMPLKDAITMIAAICGLTEEIAGEIDTEDIENIMENFQNFLSQNQTNLINPSG